MFNKTFLVNKIVNSLLKESFEVFVTRGCFDVAARREKLMLIKSLINIDGLSSEQAFSLRTISYFVSAYPFVVSMKNNREFLSGDIIYSRFGLPVVTPKMFSTILEEEAYSVYAAKGKHTIEINTEELRKKRMELEYTLEELAELIGISKKALYEIENKRVNPTKRTAKKLEQILKVKLKKTYKLQMVETAYIEPINNFQSRVSKELSRIGIENSAVRSSPIEIVGKESFSVLTALSKNTRKIKKEAVEVKKLSSFFSSYGFFVTQKSHEQAIEGLPVLLESELSEIKTAKELNKILNERI